MTEMGAGSEPIDWEDFEDVEWELLCSAREATVGLVAVPGEHVMPVLPGLLRAHPWDRR